MCHKLWLINNIEMNACYGVINKCKTKIVIIYPLKGYTQENAIRIWNRVTQENDNPAFFVLVKHWKKKHYTFQNSNKRNQTRWMVWDGDWGNQEWPAINKLAVWFVWITTGVPTLLVGVDNRQNPWVALDHAPVERAFFCSQAKADNFRNMKYK